MDAQLKKGLLEICVLKAIEREESYGYKIISDLAPCIEISESTLYPILRRLEANGAVTTRTAAHNGRLRKYYGITQAGLARLQEFQQEWAQMEQIYRFVTREEAKADD